MRSSVLLRHIYVFTFLAIFLTGVATKADAVETWAKAYGGFGTTSVNQTSDGGYIVSGGVSGTGRGIVKIDQYGEIEWQKILQDSGGGSNKMVAKQTQDGGYLLVFDTNMSFATKKWDIVVIKFDQYGNILWQNFFGTEQWDAFSDLELTNDGGFLIVGSHYIDPYFSNSLVIKADLSGNIEWQKEFNLKIYDFGRYIAQTSDGGIIVVGDAFSPNQSTDVFMLRLDNLGNVLWKKAVGGSGPTDSVGPQGFAITPDDGYILVTLYSNNAIIHKFDSNGTLQWQKSYAQTDPYYLSISGIKLTYDGTGIHNGYILSGSHSTFKLDLYGNIQWQKPYGLALFEITADGGIIIGEATVESNLFKLDENGDTLNCQIDPVGSSDVTESALVTVEKNLSLGNYVAASIREASSITVPSQNVVSYSACADSPPPSVLSIMKPGWPAQGNVTADVGILACNGGTGTCTARYPSDTMVTLTATPNIGSILSGWSGGGCSGTGDCQVILSGDTTVTATFGLASYTVTPSVGANGSLSPSTPQTVYYNQTTWFTVTPAAGYLVDSITGCGGSLSGNTYVTGPITANCTVTASFKPLYTLTVTLSGNATGVVHSLPTPDINCATGTCGQEYGSGTVVTLTAIPDSGKIFDRWSGACSGSIATCQVTMDAAKSVDAKFKK